MSSNFRKFSYNLKRYGLWFTLKKVLKKIFHIKEKTVSNQERYIAWMEKNNPTKTELEAQKEAIFEEYPKFSVVVPMYNPKEKYIEELINSVVEQTYDHWELCIADGSDHSSEKIKKKKKKDKRIKYKYLSENNGISENTNEAIKMAEGDYLVFVDHDDLIPKETLYELTKAINENKDADFIYSDHDKINDRYERFDPYFKPDYSPETLECNNYITHLVAVKKSLQEKVGFLNSKFDGAQDFDFNLRCTEIAKCVIHIPKILYHWRVSIDSTADTADAKPYAFEAGIGVVEAHLERLGRKGKVTQSEEVPGFYKIEYEIIGNPKVSILIPSKDNTRLLKSCIDSILKYTTYPNYEIVIIENNSKPETFDFYKKIIKNDRIVLMNYTNNSYLSNKEAKTLVKPSLPLDGFNYSALINCGVKNVIDSDYIIQLNNDTKIITPNWIELMLGYAQYKDIGAVGARLYYEDKTIQHAGIAYGIGGTAGNLLVNLPYGKHAYYNAEAQTRNVSAITGACLMSRKEIYEEVGYMNEDLKVAFNDVDFCLKILEKGHRLVYNPNVELVHYESKTRGYEISKEKQERFEKESEKFKNKWKSVLKKPDPYYNINFTRETCNFDIKGE